MTRLWDVFMLGDELDMLECRLREYGNSPIWRHVVVESLRTHRGDRKHLHYQENRERFAPWADRIVHVVQGDLPDGPDPWVAEHAQRDAALTALVDAADDDVVLICDVDEFPPPQFLVPDPASRMRQRLEPDAAVAFRQRVAMYAVDWEYPGPQLCAVAARAGYAREHGLAAVRDARTRYPQINGGWHLSWIGPQAQQAKLGVHCHLEMTPQQAARIAAGSCYRDGIHHTGFHLTPVDVDDTWPKWVYQRKCPPAWFRPHPWTPF